MALFRIVHLQHRSCVRPVGRQGHVLIPEDNTGESQRLTLMRSSGALPRGEVIHKIDSSHGGYRRSLSKCLSFWEIKPTNEFGKAIPLAARKSRLIGIGSEAADPFCAPFETFRTNFDSPESGRCIRWEVA